MAGRHRGAQERDRDRRVIAQYYLQGKSQYEIADLTGLSQSTVQRDLGALRGIWLKSALIDFNAARAKELAKIDLLELTYWQAWEESKVDTTIRGGAEDENPLVTQREGAGDPAYLAGVERCVSMRVKLLGLNSPQLLAVVDEEFDQAQWNQERDARHARALAVLEQAENGEDQ